MLCFQAPSMHAFRAKTDTTLVPAHPHNLNTPPVIPTSLPSTPEAAPCWILSAGIRSGQELLHSHVKMHRFRGPSCSSLSLGGQDTYSRETSANRTLRYAKLVFHSSRHLQIKPVGESCRGGKKRNKTTTQCFLELRNTARLQDQRALFLSPKPESTTVFLSLSHQNLSAFTG